jgi:hypothetical protein
VAQQRIFVVTLYYQINVDMYLGLMKSRFQDYLNMCSIKKNEIMSFAGKWMEPEISMLNEISQAQKSKYCMFSLISGI